MINKFKRWLKQYRRSTYLQPIDRQLKFDMPLLAGKNVLITGAGKNIGKGIALEMAQQGANIYFTEIDKDRYHNLLKVLEKYPGKAFGFLCDSSNPTTIDNLLAALNKQQIVIDILVNNTALKIEKSAIKDFHKKDWEQSYNVNLFSPLYLTKKVADEMIAQKKMGSIIFISSIHQWQYIGWPSYSTSKAALGMLIKELAVELASSGIRVNGIAPGWVEENEKGMVRNAKYTLLHGHSIPPKYIGRTAVYLAADYFSLHTTGTVLTVDGGLSLCNFHVIQSMQSQ